MSRSRLDCRMCGASLGYINTPSRILHLAPGVAVTFVNLTAKTATVQCPCGATMQFTGRAIALEA